MTTQLKIVLSGGPSQITDEERVQQVEDLEQPVKLLRGNGREHFEYSGKSVIRDGVELPQFEWVAHTDIAE